MTKREEIEDKITALFCGTDKELALDVLNDMFDPSDLFNEQHMDHLRKYLLEGYVRKEAVKDAVKVKELSFFDEEKFSSASFGTAMYNISGNKQELSESSVFKVWTNFNDFNLKTDSLAAAKNACQRDFNEYIKSALEG